MDIQYTAEQLAFRDEVRAFLAEHLDAGLARKVARLQPLVCVKG